MSTGHHRRRPKCENEAQVDRMPHETVQRWRGELLLFELDTAELGVDLLQAEEAEVADQAGANQHHRPAERR